MRAPRLFICRDKNTQGCLPGRLRIFIGQKPTLNERGEWFFTQYICTKAADGSIVNGWNATQVDILSEDLVLVDPNE